MRNVAIVAPHFPPSNLAGVHRARLLSQHLEDFGWRPIIVTTHWHHYEEELDRELASLVDPSLRVIHTSALPTKPVRLIGDIGIRSLLWHHAALRKLRDGKEMDFLLITVPSFYSALLGQMLYRQAPLPFGIDYIDPWVHIWPEAEIKFSKAWFSMKLGKALEPWAVRNAALITAVAPGYYEGVLERNPDLRERAVAFAMPYGFSTHDFLVPAVKQKALTLFDPHDGLVHLVYAGALLPRAHGVLESLLKGVARLRAQDAELARCLRLHFVGTGKAPNDRQGYNVMPVATRIGVEGMVTEHPHRMAYLDVLAHLTKAHGVLILGSTEPHYTPSKVYQSVQSRRPVLAILHEDSTAVDVLRKSGAGLAITINEARLPEPAEIAEAMKRFITMSYDSDRVNWSAFDAFSARESARVLAQAMDEALARRPNG